MNVSQVGCWFLVNSDGILFYHFPDNLAAFAYGWLLASVGDFSIYVLWFRNAMFSAEMVVRLAFCCELLV